MSSPLTNELGNMCNMCAVCNRSVSPVTFRLSFRYNNDVYVPLLCYNCWDRYNRDNNRLDRSGQEVFALDLVDPDSTPRDIFYNMIKIEEMSFFIKDNIEKEANKIRHILSYLDYVDVSMFTKFPPREQSKGLRWEQYILLYTRLHYLSTHYRNIECSPNCFTCMSSDDVKDPGYD